MHNGVSISETKFSEFPEFWLSIFTGLIREYNLTKKKFALRKRFHLK